MKKVTVVNSVNGLSFGSTLEDEAAASWKAKCIADNSWGKPERWVRVIDPEYSEVPENPETRVEEIEGIQVTFYKIPCEYEITEVDLTNDYNYLLEQCYANRQAEYPSLQDITVSLWEKIVEARDGTAALQAAREAIKTKYPKPEEN